MTGLEIALFILGTAFIVISFFIVGNNDRTPKAAATSALDADSFEQLREGFVTKSQKEADIILAETREKLEDVSNDKIIAVGEYSDQILEKIGSNHKEVVFLYQMLNEKEEELKATATKMDNIRIECEKMVKEAETAAKTVETASAAAAAVPKAQAASTTVKRPAAARTRTPEPVVPSAITAKQPAAAKAPAGTTATAQTSARPVTRVAKPAAAPAADRPSVMVPPQDGSSDGAYNRNDEIIALYRKGKSVMEISKLLGIGQGEVKLIINLYC